MPSQASWQGELFKIRNDCEEEAEIDAYSIFDESLFDRSKFVFDTRVAVSVGSLSDMEGVKPRRRRPLQGWGRKFPASFPGSIYALHDWSPESSESEGEDAKEPELRTKENSELKDIPITTSTTTDSHANIKKLAGCIDHCGPLSSKRGEFRLLAVHAAPDLTQEINCSLCPTTLAQCPRYCALSYVWGDQTDKRAIIINGTRTLVTASLEAALRRFRRRFEEVIMWADAMCINQEDLEEKADQVSQMRQIYQAAQKTWIWLGEEADNSDLAFDVLGCWKTNRRSASDLDLFARADVWEALALLLQRRWFYRIWVIQELVVSKDARLVCGKRTMRYKSFVSALTAYFSMHNDWVNVQTIEDGLWLQVQIDRLLTMRRVSQRFRNNQHTRLWALWSDLGVHSEVTDPRDKLFALLGLAAEEDRTGIQIDYKKALNQVYIEAAVHFIKWYGLDILRIERAQAGEELPSWVPNWTTIPLTHSRTVRPIKGYQNPNFNLWPRFSEDLQVLHLSGVVIDDIRSVGHHKLPESGEYTNEVDFIPTIREWRKIALQYQGQDKTPYTKLPGGEFEAFWRTLVLNTDYFIHKIAVDRFGEMCESLIQETLDEGNESSLEYEEHFGPESLYATTSFVSVLGRNFFITSEGYFGLGDSFIRVGDLICLLNGGNVPFILRKKDKGYILVGQSYIHGLMNGEGFEIARSRDTQEFFIF